MRTNARAQHAELVRLLAGMPISAPTWSTRPNPYRADVERSGCPSCGAAIQRGLNVDLETFGERFVAAVRALVSS